MSESEKKSGFGFGFTEIIVLACIIAFVVLVVIPNRVDSRKGPGLYSNACINNMRQIDAAANQFALEHGKTNGDAVNFPDDLTNYIKLNKYGKIPPCPSGGFYTLKKIGDKPVCSLGTNFYPPHVMP